jgi:outer membrane biosynthesis protein TonB
MHQALRRRATPIGEPATHAGIGRPVVCSWLLSDCATTVEVCWDPAEAVKVLSRDEEFGLQVGEVSPGLPRHIRLYGVHPVSAEHGRDSRLHTSLAVMNTLQEQLAHSYSGDMASTPRVLGIYASSPGPAIRPTPELTSALREYCGVPPGLLLLTHSVGSLQVGAFFLWDEMGIEQESRMLLPLAAPRPAGPVPVAIPYTPPPAVQPQPAVPKKVEARKISLNSLALGVTSALSLVLATVAVVAVWQRPASQPPPAPIAQKPAYAEVIPPPENGVSLGVLFEGPRMRVLWNPAAAPIRSARRAYISIQDGGGSKNIPLSPDELQSGTVWYVPQSPDLTLRLVAVSGNHEFSESLRVLTTDSARDSEPAKPVRVAVAVPTPTPAAEQEAPPPVVQEQPKAPRPAPKQFVPVTVARSEPEATIIPPQTQTERSSEVLSQAGPALMSGALSAPPPQFAKPEAPPAALTSFVAPEPKLRFPLPPTVHLRRFISKELAVEVYLKIDPSGRVTHAEAQAQKDVYAKALADISVQTARQWTFEPARRNGTATAGDFTVIFRFRPQQQ